MKRQKEQEARELKRDKRQVIVEKKKQTKGFSDPQVHIQGCNMRLRFKESVRGMHAYIVLVKMWSHLSLTHHC